MPTVRYRHTSSMTDRGSHAPALLCLLLLTPSFALAQSPPSTGGSRNNSSNSSNNDNSFNPNFNPSMAIVIVVLISAFFFLGFSSIFIRNCAERDEEGSVRGGGGRAVGARSRRQQGMKPEVLETFPALVYSEVKEHKIGKGVLECAVCLSEFEDDETLRLLPGCNHVFHIDCIDAWLSSHVTCPVCRSNLVDAANRAPDSSAPAGGAGHDLPVSVPSPPPEHVAVVIDQEEEEVVDQHQQMKEEAMELAELGSQQRESRSRTGRQPTRFPRSHSTGHSMVPQQPTAAVGSCECPDRYTLRLPEHVMKEIFTARKFHRSTSCVTFPTDGEGSSRPGYRAGEGSSRGGRSVRGFGRSDRRPSFFLRTLSAKFPTWRRGGGDGEESVKKGNGDGSTTKGRFAVVMTPFECLSGSATAADSVKAEGAAVGSESKSKSGALARGV